MIAYKDALLLELEANRRRGWAQIQVHGIVDGACTCGRARCPSPGKHPVHAGWTATTLQDADALRIAFARNPNHNLGIVTGQVNKIFVVDVDVKHGGDHSVAQLAKEGCLLDSGCVAHTGGGGYHIFFQLPPDVTVRGSAGAIAPGIDIRGEKGMVVCAPSRHTSGNPYQWAWYGSPELAPLWLLDRIQSAAPKPSLVADPDGEPILEGSRNTTLVRLAGSIHRQGVGGEGVFQAIAALNKAVCVPPLDDSEIMAIAVSSGKWEPQNERGIIDPKDYLELADVFLRSHFSHVDGRTLHYYRGDFWKWTGRSYQLACADNLRARAVKEHAQSYYHTTGKEPKAVRFKPNMTHGREFMRALETKAIIPMSAEWPSWSGEDLRCPPSEILAVDNGLLHVPTKKLLPHTPCYLNRASLPVAYNEDALTPKAWLAFLAELWPEDPETIETLQTIFGYVVAGGTEQQKMFLLLGPPRSGKGTIGAVLEDLVGHVNSVSPTLSCLAGSFGLEPLLHKRLALISDCRLGKRADQSAIVEKLLPYSAGDTVLANRKNKQMQASKPTARFLFLTNELPGFFDASGALASRFIILQLMQSFVGREDPRLKERFVPELSSILNWSLDGLDKLAAVGHFVQPAGGEEAAQEMRELTSQVATFVTERCVIGLDQSISQKGLFEAYNRWLIQEQGWSSTITRNQFTRDLRAVVPFVRKTRPIEAEGLSRPRKWLGIGLKRLDVVSAR